MPQTTLWKEVPGSFSVKEVEALMRFLAKRLCEQENLVSFHIREDRKDTTRRLLEWRCRRGLEAGYEVRINAYVEGWQDVQTYVKEKQQATSDAPDSSGWNNKPGAPEKTAWNRIPQPFPKGAADALADQLFKDNHKDRIENPDSDEFDIEFRVVQAGKEYFIEWQSYKELERDYKMFIERFAWGWTFGMAWVAQEIKKL